MVCDERLLIVLYGYATLIMDHRECAQNQDTKNMVFLDLDDLVHTTAKCSRCPLQGMGVKQHTQSI